jgi:hypothetical protein
MLHFAVKTPKRMVFVHSAVKISKFLLFVAFYRYIVSTCQLMRSDQGTGRVVLARSLFLANTAHSY